MGETVADKTSKILAFIAVAFGFVALILCCVGVGTMNWYNDGNANYITTRLNFFTYCTYDGTTGNQIGCVSRTSNDHGACDARYTTTDVVNSYSDCNNRMRNAAALTIVGIIFLAFGIVLTLVMAFGILSEWFLNFIPGALLFLASLFMLAGLAEGARYITYNGYSASLYETGHLLTILSLFLSAVAGGRISHACGGGN
ncbi:unnamed protein product [Adineta steineri]|uniref:Uncharacterized protein n=1 Tax=Adineta steineri TaxID=433720 RepID=A0A819R3L9_9BILA|nr:unnamed protein product [Adineta steineri]CAF3526763.1 unnamed protein product [Adineta steineri]CAF4035990.1 unnamed protein product [Adineta steineri]